MIDFFNVILLIFGITVFLFSIIHYKFIFNPLGIYVLIWTTIIFLYNLQLSFYLKPLDLKSYLILYLGTLMFILGCFLKTKRKYKYPVDIDNIISRKKIYFFYFVLLSFSIIEILIKTPPLLSNNPLAVYHSGGIGVRFLHYSIILTPISYIYIFLDDNISKSKKFLFFIPVVLFPLLWMQRGILMTNIISIAVIYFRSIKINRQIILVVLLVIVLVFSINVIGNYRSATETDSRYIYEISNMKVNIPNELVWIYIYPTSSVYNLYQTLNNNNFKYIYGYNIVEPIFSLLQFKSFNIEEIFNYNKGYEITGGFNTPTFYHWSYRNFGYLGLIFVPFFLGFVSQILFNKFRRNKGFFIVFYAIWIPNLIFSFHDFLFWNSGMILSIIFIVFLNYRFKIRY